MKRSFLVLLSFLLILVLLQGASAQTVTFDYSFLTDDVLRVSPVLFAEEALVDTHGNFPSYMYEIIYQGELVSTQPLEETNTFTIEDMVSPEFILRIQKNSTLVFEKKISLCDKDGLCEPCIFADCFMAENMLSCPTDCDQSTTDLFCLNLEDGICDLECQQTDPDCLEFEEYALEKPQPSREKIKQAYIDFTQEKNIPLPYILEQEVKQQNTSQTRYYDEISQERPQVLLRIFILAGALLLVAAIFFIYKRVHHSERAHNAQKNLLHSYVIKMRKQGFDDARIKESLKKRGYTDSFIKILFKTLEAGP